MIKSIRVATIDRQPLFRDGIKQLIVEAQNFQFVAQGTSGRDAIGIARDFTPDILLIDTDIDGGGIDTIREVYENAPSIKSIILTASVKLTDLSAALVAGARGYVLKNVEPRRLLKILGAVSRGESYVEPRLAGDLLLGGMHNRQPKAIADLRSLTAREFDVLDLVAEGRTNKEIARTLKLTEKTVKHYMTSIMMKLQVRNRVEAALLAQRQLGEALSPAKRAVG